MAWLLDFEPRSESHRAMDQPGSLNAMPRLSNDEPYHIKSTSAFTPGKCMFPTKLMHQSWCQARLTLVKSGMPPFKMPVRSLR
jgi:hypothetical protein